jgi:hypothetical protein
MRLCETTYTGPAPKTKAAAAKIRKNTMKACGCQRCTWALEGLGKKPMYSAGHLAALKEIEAERMAARVETDWTEALKLEAEREIMRLAADVEKEGNQ